MRPGRRPRPKLNRVEWLRYLSIAVAAMVVMPLLRHAPQELVAQSAAPVALHGVVSSEGEPHKEGVLVTARRNGGRTGDLCRGHSGDRLRT